MHDMTLRPWANRGLRLLSASALTAGVLAGSAVAVQADEALADLVEEVSPAVVTVLSSREAAALPTYLEGLDLPEDLPFRDLFRRFLDNGELPEMFRSPMPREGIGSGFIVEADGLIVTNFHVIENADKVTVRLGDDRVFDAEIVGSDPQTDIAVLRIDAGEALPFVEFGDSDEIRVGEDVVALGNPFGLGGTVTSGIVSAKGRNLSSGPYAEFLQTDAAINKGNSGGPLFNMEGEVVGVNSAIYSPNGGSVGLGFALTSNSVEVVIDDLKDDGEIDRAWLGVSIQAMTPELAEALGLDETRGALVSSVIEDGPSAGILEQGDVIVEFAGKRVDSNADLPRLVGAEGVGQNAEIKVFRDGKMTTLNVELGELDGDLAMGAPELDGKTSDEAILGATVAPLTETAREQIGLAPEVEGVVVTSLSDTGPARKAGIQVGDVIVRVGDMTVSSASDITSALGDIGDAPALILVNRSGQQIFLAVEVS